MLSDALLESANAMPQIAQQLEAIKWLLVVLIGAVITSVGVAVTKK